MGLALSNNYVSNTVNSLSQIISDTVNTVTQTVSTQCNASNVFKLQAGTYATSVNTQTGQTTFAQCTIAPGSFDINITQTASNSCNLTAGLTNDLSVQLNQTLANNINNWLSANAKANNGFLGFGISIANNIGINQTNLSQKIANDVTNNITQVCTSILDASNFGYIQVCGNYNVNAVQSAVNTNLTTCLINNLVNNIQSDNVLNNIVQQAAASANANNSGLDLSGIIKWILIIGGIIIALIIIGVLLWLIFGSKGTPEQKAGENQTEQRRQLEIALARRRIEKEREVEYETHELAPEREGEGEREGGFEGGGSEPSMWQRAANYFGGLRSPYSSPVPSMYTTAFPPGLPEGEEI